ncbi:MAG: methyltransferase domain-containing protein [Alphaproteobacteria bacterium]
MNQDIKIFDRTLLPLKRARAARHFDDAGFLFDWSKKQLQSRLDDITRNFETAIQIGARGGKIIPHTHTIDLSPAFTPSAIADEEFLPFKNQSLDLALSNLHLHAANDLPGVLTQIKRALKPDGLFIASLFGGETLHELRSSLNHAEITLRGGLSPRVAPFADKQDCGALLQRAGFALPVIDSDIITVTYDNAFKLMHDLRNMGESNIIAARDKRYTGKAFFMEAAKHYAENYSEPDGRIAASFEIISLIGWAPHNSQQQPLKPGSAQTRLADILKTNEEKL